MNIENIGALAAQVQTLGFDNPGLALLRRISFKPAEFTIVQHMYKNGEAFSFNLMIENDQRQGLYYLKYYDAMLHKDLVGEDAVINGCNVNEITSMFSIINWASAFDFNDKKNWTITDKTSWEREYQVESAMAALQKLEQTDEGKIIATRLKLKYWNDLPYQEIFGNIAPLKSKGDVSQRFYFSEDQQGISASEAVRFLQNRWLEKQMQAKSKINDESNAAEKISGSDASSSTGLVKKKHLAGRKGSIRINQRKIK